MSQAKEHSPSADRKLWRVRGIGSSGKPFELRLRATDHASALRCASKPFVRVESCVLIEGPANG